MAITTPPKAQPTSKGPARGIRQGAKVEKKEGGLAGRLRDAGLVGGKKSAKQVAGNLAGGLSSRGFTGAGPDAFAQLTSALTQLQSSHGLAITGSLDAKTMEALKKLGLVESSIGVAPASHKTDAFENLSQSASKSATTTTTAPNGQPLESAVDTLLGAMKSVIEGMLGEGALAASKNESDPNATQAHASQGAAAENADESHARRDGFGDKDPNGKGADSGDQSAKKGKAKKSGEKSGRVGEGDEDEGAAEEGQDRDGAAGDGDEDGTELETGNAASGDDDLSDRKRGHASTGDDDEGAGHYRIETLEEQVRKAMTTLTRTEATATRATTYAFEVTLYRPGVYGAGQKAAELLRLVVKDASAFDDAWAQARESLQRLCKIAEPKAQLPTEEDWRSALRRARVQ